MWQAYTFNNSGYIQPNMIFFPPFADLKAAPGTKYGRTANPSPMGTPQRKAAEMQQSQVQRCACFTPLHFQLCVMMSCGA